MEEGITRFLPSFLLPFLSREKALWKPEQPSALPHLTLLIANSEPSPSNRPELD